MNIFLCNTVIFTFVLTFTNAKPALRIFHGEDALLGEFPSFAHLQASEFYCGGVLLDNMTVLTTALCNLVHTVHIGRHIFEMDILNHTVIDIAEHRPHDDFNRHSLINDIELIKLKEPVPESVVAPNQYPILNVTELSENPTEDLNCTFVGFGFTSNTDETSLVLQKKKLKIRPNSECNFYRDYEKYFFCAQAEDDATLCNFEVGGPLYCTVENQLVLYGLFSRDFDPGYYGCYKKENGFFVKINYYLDWIQLKRES